MLTVIHGDDLRSSRLLLTSLQKDRTNTVVLQEDKLTLEGLMQNLGTGSLFGETKLIVIEELFAKIKSANEQKKFLAFINEYSSSNEIVLWEGKDLTKTQLASLQKATIRHFKLPQSLFHFLDAIKPNNGKEAVSFFHESLQNSEREMLFFMLVRQMRLLLAFLSGAEVEEIKRMSPWQKTKLQKQAKYWQQEILLRFYQRLYDLEKGMKTGTLVFPLDLHIDMLLSEL